VGSISDRVSLHTVSALRRDAAGVAAQASANVARNAAGCWVHVDLDVLDRSEFRACGAADDPAMPEGMTWSHLTTITKTAMATEQIRGWNIGVYNPDLDPDGVEARRIVTYVTDVAWAWRTE
jgi:arginase